MLRIALLATLRVSTPVLFAKERILVHRIGSSQSTLFIANADGSDERPLLPEHTSMLVWSTLHRCERQPFNVELRHRDGRQFEIQLRIISN